MSRPNILFIISDQHNARMLGAAGDSTARTPNMDRIAERGVRFDRAYTVNPICSPTRISLYTGLEVAQHGYHGNSNWAVTDDCSRFLPTLLRRSGYQTGLVGRSHMVWKWDHEGFDHVAYMNFGDCDRYRLEDNPWLMHLIACDAADHYDISLPCSAAPEGGFTSSMPLAHCEEMWVAEEAVGFLRARDRQRPFYLHVGYDHPHDPVAPPAEFDRLFSPEMVRLPANHTDTFLGKPDSLYKRRHQPGGYPHTPRDDEHLRWLVAKQYALVALIDESIGRILAEVEAQGELENTLIVYTADHGDFAGEHGMILKNLGIYESVHRIPCIVSWPGRWQASTHSDEMIEIVDLYPTLLRAGGVDPPASDGRALGPLVQGRSAGRDHVICDWEKAWAIRTDRFRLVGYEGSDQGELYDHADDPGEIRNLWDDPAYASRKGQLRALLSERVRPGPVRTSLRSEAAGTAPLRNQWFREDSPIYAMWKYGVRWSELAPYLEERPEGGQRLSEPAHALARRFPFRLPAI